MNYRRHLGWGAVPLVLLGFWAEAARAINLEQQLDLRPVESRGGQSRDVADGWMQLGNQQFGNGDLEQAIAAWAEAAEIYRLLGDTEAAGRAYGSIGATLATLGRYSEAERAFILRIGTAGDGNDPIGQVYGLNNLGSLYVNQGRLVEAQRHFEEALQIARTTGDNRAVGVSLSNLGQVASQRGDLDTAARLLEAAANFRLLAGDSLGEAHSSNSLGDVYLAQGRESSAIGAYRVALGAGVEAGIVPLQIRALDGLLTIYLGRNDLRIAREYLDQRAALTLGTSPPDLQTALTYRWLGDYHLKTGETTLAQTAFSQGLQIARNLQQKSLEAEFVNRLLALR